MQVSNLPAWRTCARAARVLMFLCALLAILRPPACAQATEPQQPPPQNPAPPPETQPADNKPANPVQAVEDKTKQAAELTKDAAAAGLIKARDWESSWIEGVYLRRDQPLITLTATERRQIYLQQTLTTPGAYMKRMFQAGIDQARGTPSQWDDGLGGFAERFASREGQFITANTLAALGNAKLGYEVRYDKCKCSGLWPRTRHAFIRNLLTYDRSEQRLHPQWALYGGAFGGGMLATTWKPGPKNVFSQGALAMAGQLGWGTLLNFVTEFSREINRKQGVNQ